MGRNSWYGPVTQLKNIGLLCIAPGGGAPYRVEHPPNVDRPKTQHRRVVLRGATMVCYDVQLYSQTMWLARIRRGLALQARHPRANAQMPGHQ